MKQNNILRENYTSNEQPYQLKLPIELSTIIPDNDSVRLFRQIICQLDLKQLYATYARLHEDQASPAQMLSILLYAYHEGIYSSRKIETACCRDINFMYLLQGKPVPDYSTIARFRTLHFGPCARNLMAQFTRFLQKNGEISGKEIFIDGTKIEANANKYTFVWKKSTTKNMRRLMDKTAALVESLVNRYGLKPIWHGLLHRHHLKQIERKLCRIKREEGIQFVHGAGHRKTQLQRDLETLRAYRKKLTEYIQKCHICGSRNSYSKTDHDATFMRMKEDYMRNGQLKPCYNLQFGVDSGYISWLSITPNPTDTRTLVPFLISMRRALKFQYETVVADSGYESERNYTYLEDHGIRAMIKPSNYEISKSRKFQKDISRRENMDYNYDGDFYTCRGGYRLYPFGMYRRKKKDGYVQMVTTYQCHNCKGCPWKADCIKGRNWKTPEEERFKKLNVSRKFERQRLKSLRNITSEEGTMLRMNRTIQAEGAFATLKEDRGFRKFLTRGKENVYAESVLMAISQNIDHFHRRIQSGRLGEHLYPLKTA